MNRAARRWRRCFNEQGPAIALFSRRLPGFYVHIGVSPEAPESDRKYTAHTLRFLRNVLRHQEALPR